MLSGGKGPEELLNPFPGTWPRDPPPSLRSHFTEPLSNISCFSFHMKLTEGRAAKVTHLLFKFLAFKNTLLLATDDLSAGVSAHVRVSH